MSTRRSNIALENSTAACGRNMTTNCSSSRSTLFKDRWLANNEIPISSRETLPGRWLRRGAIFARDGADGGEIGGGGGRKRIGAAGCRERAERLDYSNVTFKQASALELPFRGCGVRFRLL